LYKWCLTQFHAARTVSCRAQFLGEAGRRLVRERYAPAVVGPAMRRAYDMAISARPAK
jgi:hypothetical protein